MRTRLIMIFLCFAFSAFASQPSQETGGDKAVSQPASLQGSQLAPSQTSQPAALQSRGCLAVKDAGSHAVRNILLAGVAGALISKKQYKVVDAVGYPARIGQKFHGNDLQTLQGGGTRIVILDKKYSPEDLQRACR